MSSAKKHPHPVENWHHSHAYDDESRAGRLQRRTLIVAILTAVMMAGEIFGGWYFGSMAVLADGWHMGTHAFALGLAFFSYWYARRNAGKDRFTFGTGKVNALGAFASALFLAMVGFLMIETSIERLFNRTEIRYAEALAVAVLGLAVNLLCALIMTWRVEEKSSGHDHQHHGNGRDSDHHQGRDHHRNDHNFRAALIHVISDAVTSVLAILALAAAMLRGWDWLDPAMGIVGALLILVWAWGLVRTTGRILLDSAVVDSTFVDIRKILESLPGTSVSDLHVWYVANHRKAAIVSIVADHPEPPLFYKKHLRDIADLDHISVEVNQCEHCEKAQDNS